MSETSSFETPADAGEGDAGLVRLWLEAITLARKTEEAWRKRAQEALDRYRDEKERKGRRFNILFANTQTLLPAIYNSTPVPDIRRRFGDADPVGKVAAQVLERAVSYATDAYDFDATMRSVCFDMALPGRGVARIRYEPTLTGEGDDQQIADEAVTCEPVDWQDFIRGPGRRWPEVPWIAFEHRLTREELTERFGDIGKTMPLDFVQDGAGKEDNRDVPDVFKRGTVYEIWDKQAREVLFVAPSVADRILKREADPLKLRDFFCVPRPVYDAPDSTSLVPLVPFDRYRDQAEELDRVTARITALTDHLKWRGARAADVTEFNQIAEAKDGDFVAVQNYQQFLGATGGGGLDKALWMMPIDVLRKVIDGLLLHREQIKQVIYEITGLSDILRGASEAQETATAQEIKAEWGSLRIQERQAEIQRFARDLIRLKAEIIAERFQPQTLAMVTGMDLPTGEMKAQAQMAAQQGAQDPKLQAILSAPSWDDVVAILRSDAMRSYRVDIETDSTVRADTTRARQQAAQFVEGFGAFVTAVGPAVQAGMMPMDVTADLLTAFARQFKLGRQAEDALERLGQQAQQPKPEQPDPMAAEMKKAEMDAQMRQAEMQQQGQIEQAKLAANMQIEQMKIEAQTALERERMAMEQQRHAETMQADREKFTVDAQLRMADGERSAGLEREKMANSERTAVESAKAKAAPESKAAEQIAALAEGVQQVATVVDQVAQRVDALGAAVAEVAEDMAAPVEAVRGGDGRIAEVRRGKRVLRVARGDDGRAAGLI
jgi:hypothetical protein